MKARGLSSGPEILGSCRSEVDGSNGGVGFVKKILRFVQMRNSRHVRNLWPPVAAHLGLEFSGLVDRRP